MKSVGIIGGIGPGSTIEYYRLIIAAYREQKRDGSYPSIIINSIDLRKMLDLIEANQLAEVTAYLVGEVQKLAEAGVDFGLFASNTPHIVFEEIRRQSPIPLVSIVEATCVAAKTLGLNRLGLFGTRSTMRGRFYPDVFSKAGVSLVVPDEPDQSYIHEKYMKELVNGIFLPETRERLLAIADRLTELERIQGLILGGTELPLLFQDKTPLKKTVQNNIPQDVIAGRIPLLDTTRIHVRAIVAELLSH